MLGYLLHFAYSDAMYGKLNAVACISKTVDCEERHSYNSNSIPFTALRHCRSCGTWSALGDDRRQKYHQAFSLGYFIDCVFIKKADRGKRKKCIICALAISTVWALMAGTSLWALVDSNKKLRIIHSSVTFKTQLISGSQYSSIRKCSQTQRQPSATPTLAPRLLYSWRK